MATNIAGLTTAGAVNDADLLWLEQSGLPRKLSVSALRSALAASGNFARLDTSLQTITAPADWRLAANTLAGSDTLQLRLQSGGAFNTSRGAILELNGANAAATPGAFRLLGSAGSTSVINGGTGSTVQFQVSTYEFAGTPRFAAIAEFVGGTVSTQRIHARYGWSNGVQRWTTAMESDATFSFYNYDTGGSTASRLLNLIGANMGAARLMVFGEVVGHLEGGAAGQMRMVGGNYGAFFRNDGTNLYLLMTASGDQFGSYNTLRPLTVSVSTGLVSMANGLSFGSATGASNTDLSKHIGLYGTQYGFSVTGSRLNYVAPNFARHYFMVNGVDAMSVEGANQSGTLTVAGGVWTAGPNAVMHIIDRTSSRQWGIYGSGDLLRWWNGTGDIMTLNSAGTLHPVNLNPSGTGLYIQDKLAVQGTDSWLRLNNSGNFASGIYTPYNFRCDANVDLSNSGYLTLQGGLRLSKITVSTSAPGTMQNGELWIQY